MRCLLDKVAARYTIQGLLKLAEGRDLTDYEVLTLDLLERASSQQIDLFIAPPTLHVLQQIKQLPQYTGLIQLFLKQVQVAFPTRYFARWARRLREHQFSREDAAILALATFGTDVQGSILSLSVVATCDQPMITNWRLQHARIREQFATMQANLPQPYRQAVLPDVLRPEQIVR
jgi:hypothetical protein